MSAPAEELGSQSERVSRLLAGALKNGIEYMIHTLFSSVEIIPVLLWLL